jgi:hypothetical protein
MRGDWRVTPAVGFTREQDLVHRVLGKPGVILVAEGARKPHPQPRRQREAADLAHRRGDPRVRRLRR